MDYLLSEEIVSENYFLTGSFLMLCSRILRKIIYLKEQLLK